MKKKSLLLFLFTILLLILWTCAQPMGTEVLTEKKTSTEEERGELDLSQSLTEEEQAELIQEIISELSEQTTRGKKYNHQKGGNSEIFATYMLGKLLELTKYDYPFHWEANYNHSNDEAQLGLGVRKDWIENVITNAPQIYTWQTWFSNKRKISGKLTRKKRLQAWISNFRLHKLNISNNKLTVEMTAHLHVKYQSKPIKNWLTYVNESGSIKAKLPLEIDLNTNELVGKNFELYNVKLKPSINPIIMLIFPGLKSQLYYNILKNPLIKLIGNKLLAGEIFRSELGFLKKIQEAGSKFNFAFSKITTTNVGARNYVMTYWVIHSPFDLMLNLTKSQASNKEIKAISDLIYKLFAPVQYASPVTIAHADNTGTTGFGNVLFKAGKGTDNKFYVVLWSKYNYKGGNGYRKWYKPVNNQSIFKPWNYAGGNLTVGWPPNIAGMTKQFYMYDINGDGLKDKFELKETYHKNWKVFLYKRIK